MLKMAEVAQSSSVIRHCHGNGPETMATSAEQPDTGNRAKRPSTREKIAKMVADGAVNYPAYLKLIYTGDSEQEPSSSDDEMIVTKPRRTMAVSASPIAVSRTTHLSGVRSEQLPQDELQQFTADDTNKLTNDENEPDIQRITDVDSATHCCDSELDCHNATIEGDEAKTSMISEYSAEGTTIEPQSTDEKTQLRRDLITIQEDIATIRGVLNTKLAQAANLRQLLGVQNDLRSSIQSLKRSQTFQRTNAAFKSFSAYAFRAVSNLRHSVAFKSVELKAGYLQTSQSMGNLKQRLAGLRSSKSETNVSAAIDDDAVECNYEEDSDYFDRNQHRHHSMTLVTNHVNLFTTESIE